MNKDCQTGFLKSFMLLIRNISWKKTEKLKIKNEKKDTSVIYQPKGRQYRSILLYINIGFVIKNTDGH